MPLTAADALTEWPSHQVSKAITVVAFAVQQPLSRWLPSLNCGRAAASEDGCGGARWQCWRCRCRYRSLYLSLSFSFSSLPASLSSSFFLPPRSPGRPPLLFWQQNRAMSEKRHGHHPAIGRRATYRFVPLVELGGGAIFYPRPRASPRPSRRRPRDASDSSVQAYTGFSPGDLRDRPITWIYRISAIPFSSRTRVISFVM